MRKGWTDYVAKVRRKGNRGKSVMSHREAMKAASLTWPKEKAKLLRKRKKECRRQSVAEPPEQIGKEPSHQNVESKAGKTKVV